MLDNNLHLYFTLTIVYTKMRFFWRDNGFPNNYVKVKKMLKRLGVEYISCHACLNDCILYKDDYEDKNMCPK